MKVKIYFNRWGWIVSAALIVGGLAINLAFNREIGQFLMGAGTGMNALSLFDYLLIGKAEIESEESEA